MTALLFQDYRSELIGVHGAAGADQAAELAELAEAVGELGRTLDQAIAEAKADDQAGSDQKIGGSRREPPISDQTAELVEMVEDLARAVELVGAEAGDAELAEVERQHRALEAALDDHKGRVAEALELLVWAEAAGELAGDRFSILVVKSLAAGREPGAWIRSTALWCQHQQRRGRPVRSPLFRKVLLARARQLLAGVECA
jgi:hypothetical protein